MPTPTTVSPAHQLALLELQRTDTELDQARARMQALRQDPEYQRLRAEGDRLQAEVQTAQQQLDTARSTQSEAERKVTSTREHLERNQKRMESGQGSAKDLQGMQHEIETLQRLVGEQEDAELETMDAVEQAESAHASAQHAQVQAESWANARGQTVKAEAAQVAARGKELTGTRQQQAAGLPADLVAQYEKIRARNGGIGAARLVGNRSEASGMGISPVELEQINATLADQLAYCPDTGAILVRDAD